MRARRSVVVISEVEDEVFFGLFLSRSAAAVGKKNVRELSVSCVFRGVNPKLLLSPMTSGSKRSLQSMRVWLRRLIVFWSFLGKCSRKL